MACFCTQCGKALPEEERFCTACGTQVNGQSPPQEAPAAQETVEAAAPQQQAPPESQPVQGSTAAPAQQYAQPSPTYQQPAYQQPAYQQPVYQQPASQPQSVGQPIADPTSKVVKTGTYFGLMFLFGIPLIGFLVCLVTAIAPKNKSIKNFARAQLIWTLIGLLFTILIIGALIALGNSFLNLLNEATGGELGNMFANTN